MQLNPFLRDFWQDTRAIKVLFGGRVSTKTHDSVRMLIYIATIVKTVIVFGRQYKSSIDQSIYTVIKNVIMEEDYSTIFKIFKYKIVCLETGTEFRFVGLERNTIGLKGLENVGIFLLEESEALTSEQWDLIEPLARNEGSFIILIFNPRFATDFVYTKFVLNTPEDCIVQHITYKNNPFLSEKMKKTIERVKKEDFEKYEHVYLGKPLSSSQLSIIKPEWIEASVEAESVLGVEICGRTSSGFDIADTGGDRCVIVCSKGGSVKYLESWKAREDELLMSVDRAYTISKMQGCTIIVYDSVGLGACCGAEINRNNKKQTYVQDMIRAVGFNAGSRKIYRGESLVEHCSNIKNKDFYSNLKAQSWWNVSDRLRHTYNAINGKEEPDMSKIISISKDISFLENLKIELCTPERQYDDQGRVRVESKKDLASRGVPSTDLADAFIMSLWKR
jgi:phage terminase large subunit